MGRRKRIASANAAAPSAALAAQGRASAQGVAQPAAVAAQPAGPASAVVLLGALMFLAPALGVPGEFMLQDTLKSILASFVALAAAGLVFWHVRGRQATLRWHAVLWLPLLLMAYALGSMAWSHAYLGGVEAVRWAVFTLLAWVGLNAFSRERLPWLALGIHAGAVAASLWAVLQFWFGFSLFPQGPNPASTFVNRNFFAEFVVCTLPFSALLLARARRSAAVAVLAAGCALTMLAILMTGTRAALVTMWLLLAVVLPLILWRCRAQLAVPRWSWGTRAVAVAVLLAGTVGLGLVPSGNEKILQEGRGDTALARGLYRTASISAGDSSVGLRLAMWRATVRMIADKPVTGVGAGAWEVHVPLYQPDGAELETDFYVHNEVLQLLAEYGLAGLVFLLALAVFLLRAAARTWRPESAAAGAEQPWRATALACLLALMLVSNAGFPWRMATTGVLFALALAVLAASDARLGWSGRLDAAAIAFRPAWSRYALAGLAAAAVLAAYVTRQAEQAERKLVEAARLALAISAAPDRDSPRWDGAKAEVLQQVREGIAINPHYRKITPQVADEMAAWGDWKNATWIWESVIASRPYVVAILTNIARGYMQTGEPKRALEYLTRAGRISPQAPSVLSTEVILLSRSGQDRRAAEIAEGAIARGRFDLDLLRQAFVLGWRTGNQELVERSAALMVERYPHARAGAYAELADFYWQALKDPARAAQAWDQALAAAGPARREEMLARMPPALRSRH
jgi:O-antigen ligase